MSEKWDAIITLVVGSWIGRKKKFRRVASFLSRFTKHYRIAETTKRKINMIRDDQEMHSVSMKGLEWNALCRLLTDNLDLMKRIKTDRWKDISLP